MSTDTLSMSISSVAGTAASSSSVLPESFLTHLQTITRALGEISNAHQHQINVVHPSLLQAASSAHSAQRQRYQSDFDAIRASLEQDRSEWEEKEFPNLNKALQEVGKEHAELTGRLDALTGECNQLQSAFDAAQATESRFSNRAVSSSNLGGITGLPLRCLRRVLSFLPVTDHVALIETSYGMKLRFDRGELWMQSAVDKVKAVSAERRAAAAAIEAKRRQLGGLTEDFHSSNFLAACARPSLNTAAKVAAAAAAAASLSPSSPMSPVARAELQSASEELPPNAHAQISLSIPTRPDAATGGAAGAAAGAGKKDKAGPVTLGKQDLFSRALTALQKQVDPALSDFEDLSLKYSSHQRIIGFLESQAADQKHKLGIARIEHGEEMHALRALSQEKDELAKQIQAIEKEIAKEKSEQSDIAARSEKEIRQLKAQTNLRKNLDNLVQANLADEKDDSAGNSGSGGPELTPQQEQAQMAESIALLKQQKKVLIKAVKSLHVENEQVLQEKDAYARKLEELKKQLQAFQV